MKHIYTLLLFILVVAAPVTGVAQSKGEQPSDSIYASRIPKNECDSLEWYGVTYYESGYCYYTDSITNRPCTLDLTIYHSTHNVETEIACYSFTWHGVTYTTSGTYTYNYSNADSCPSVDTLHLTIKPLPEITILAEDDTICGSGVIWVSNVNPSYEYQWNDSTTNTWISVDSSGTYYVTVTDTTNQCSKTESIAIVVNQPYLTQKDTAICQGENVDFYGQTLTETGGYTQTLQAVNGCDSVIVLTLTVKPIPNVTISGDSSFCQGSDVALTASGADTYEWTTGSHDPSITVNSAGTYTVTGVTNGCFATASKKVTANPIDTTEFSFVMCQGESYYFFGDTLKEQNDYTHTLFSSKGCDSVVVLHLIVKPRPDETFISETICQGDTFPFFGQQLTVEGEYSHTMSSANGCDSVITLTLHVNPTYNITITDIICWGESKIFGEDTLTETGVYTQTLQTVSGCDSVITLALIVRPSPTPVIYGDNEICEGETTTLTAIGGSNCSYLWSDGSTGNSINVSESGSYTVTVTNEYSCSASAAFDMTVDTLPNVSINSVSPICSLQTATLTATGASTYTWDNGLGVGNDKQVSPTETTIYSVTGTDGNGCSNTSQVTVTVNQLPNVSINPVTPICSLQNVTLTATEATNYSWSTGDSAATISVSPSATTTYSVTGTDDNGCQNTADVTVIVNPLPIVTINVVNPICSGQNTTLTAMGGNTYTWDHGLGTGNNIQVSPSVSTTYSVTGTDGNGCQNIAEVTVTVNQLPSVTINQVTPICNGQTATLTATGASTYTWDNGLGTGNNMQVSPTATTNFSVMGTDNNGCSNMAQVTVTVKPIPNVSISGKSSYCQGDCVVLTASGAGEYEWSNGNTSSSITVCYPGTYSVTGTLNGCPNYASQDVIENPVYYITMSDSICVGESYNFFGRQLSSDGEYSVTLHTSQGCDSVITLNLTYKNSSLTKKDIVNKNDANDMPYMLVYPEANLQYQWYKDTDIIDSATKQYYHPGDYSFESSLDTNACYKVMVYSPELDACGVITDCWKPSASQSTKIRILPNPNNGQFRLMLPEGTVNVQVLNANGQILMTRKVDGDEQLEMHTGLANGLYFVKSFRQDGSFNTEKLIINR